MSEQKSWKSLSFQSSLHENTQITINHYLKLLRHPTYSTVAESLDHQLSSGSLTSMPCPQQSDETISNEERYLSYIDGQKDQDAENPSFMQQYFSTLYRAVIYLRKEQMRTEIDDGLLMEQLKEHLDVEPLVPTSKTPAGELLLRNGFVLSAYSVLMSRLHGSPFLLKYLFAVFKNISEPICNRQQLQYYSQRNVESFHIPSGKKSHPPQEVDRKEGRHLKRLIVDDVEQQSGPRIDAMKLARQTIKKMEPCVLSVHSEHSKEC